ncbi:MAG: DUF1919 domain-containing protein [Candidatus Synoicihabitans palmerolidicus]|nr:DUF1919 domain-containing protein [Candidatus Synoicihabitans palmerolidicus]
MPALPSLYSLRRQWLRNYTAQRISRAGVSIISDDCWAGRLYSELGVRCRSPCVGMGFTAPEFIPFLQRIREPHAFEVLSVSREERGYPIIQTPYARLYGKHYDSETEFVRRIQRRVPLIDWDNLLIKVDLGKPKFTTADIHLWNELKLPRSVAFYPDEPKFRALSIHSGVPVKKWATDGHYMFLHTCRYFSLFTWLQTGSVHPAPRWSLAYRLLFRNNVLPDSFRKFIA